MVLRGSKVRPESTLEDSEAAVERARDYLRQAQANLRAAKKTDDLKEALASIHRRESHGEQVSPNELQDIVRVLVEKIDALEETERQGQRQVHQAERQVRDTLYQLAAGGAAGAVARTFVAPVDRVKILMQTQHVNNAGAQPKYFSLVQSIKTIVKDEGVAKLWRGNGVNCIRVVPYSGFQFASYDKIKSLFLSSGGGEQNFGVPQRLACGAGAAIVATCATYPLDMIRLRLSVQPELTGISGAVRSILADGAGGPRAFFKGFIPTVCSITPFVAINFAAFDTIKTTAHQRFPSTQNNIPATLSMGAMSGLFAQTCCYPLDLVRRRMQMKGDVYKGVVDALRTIGKEEGFRGFYKGMVPNAVKVVPNTAIRFMAYDLLKSYLGIEGKKKR
jgi:solute carrier family 25 phosphate transporter 23/24/25/41